MTNPRGVCGECGTTQRLTKDALLYKHGDCYGGGEHPATFDNTLTLGASEPVENFNNSTVGLSAYDVEDLFTVDVKPLSRKTGYTDEDLHEMLSNITPKRKKLRERIKARWEQFKKNLDDKLDVFDD